MDPRKTLSAPRPLFPENPKSLKLRNPKSINFPLIFAIISIISPQILHGRLHRTTGKPYWLSPFPSSNGDCQKRNPRWRNRANQAAVNQRTKWDRKATLLHQGKQRNRRGGMVKATKGRSGERSSRSSGQEEVGSGDNGLPIDGILLKEHAIQQTRWFPSYLMNINCVYIHQLYVGCLDKKSSLEKPLTEQPFRTIPLEQIDPMHTMVEETGSSGAVTSQSKSSASGMKKEQKNGKFKSAMKTCLTRPFGVQNNIPRLIETYRFRFIICDSTDKENMMTNLPLTMITYVYGSHSALSFDDAIMITLILKYFGLYDDDYKLTTLANIWVYHLYSLECFKLRSNGEDYQCMSMKAEWPKPLNSACWFLHMNLCFYKICGIAYYSIHDYCWRNMKYLRDIITCDNLSWCGRNGYKIFQQQAYLLSCKCENRMKIWSWNCYYSCQEIEVCQIKDWILSYDQHCLLCISKTYLFCKEHRIKKIEKHALSWITRLYTQNSLWCTKLLTKQNCNYFLVCELRYNRGRLPLHAPVNVKLFASDQCYTQDEQGKEQGWMSKRGNLRISGVVRQCASRFANGEYQSIVWQAPLIKGNDQDCNFWCGLMSFKAPHVMETRKCWLKKTNNTKRITLNYKYVNAVLL